mmetsp:Transcript_30091/g.75406  ORF Transcript_30091/g.75406 Transcript_30091/m.75406 type:complete len:149 (-) Transcript_30091:29-475(-)
MEEGDEEEIGERYKAGEGEADNSGGEGNRSTAADDDLDNREDRGIERVLNSAPLARRDAAALFQLARRVKAVAGAASGGGESAAPTGLLDEVVLAAARELVTAAAAADTPTPTVRQARSHFRTRLGLSLTNREISRALRRAIEEHTNQ